MPLTAYREGFACQEQNSCGAEKGETKACKLRDPSRDTPPRKMRRASIYVYGVSDGSSLARSLARSAEGGAPACRHPDGNPEQAIRRAETR